MTNSTEQRQDRIKYLRKQEDLNRRLPNFLNSLTSIAGQPITIENVVSIEEAVDIWKNIHENEKLQQANFSVSFPYKDKDKLSKIFEVLESTLTGQKQYFTTSKFYETCLLLLDTSFCINKFEELIEFDGDTFYIYDKEINNSLSVDTSEERWMGKEEYTWTYELRVKGLDWIGKVFNAYSEAESA